MNILNCTHEHINNHNIKRVTQTRSLGLIVDENLSWEAQFNRTMDKINSEIWALKRLKNILPRSQLSIVCYASVESQLRYGDIVWVVVENKTGCPSETTSTGSQNNLERQN